MAHPTVRVLAVLELLQAHGAISGTELARRLGVDGRTVRRYIALLEELGIPITAERGRHGAYSLVPGYKIPPLMFSEDEALALSVGLLAARGMGLSGVAPAAASALAKLERILPERLKQRVRAVDETVTLDFSHSVQPGDGAALGALTVAAQARQRVRMRYRARAEEVSERDFDPYGLAYRGGRWYAAGFCHLRRGLRSFRLDRILSVEPLAGRFLRPAGFDVLAHLTQAVASLPRAFAPEVLLLTDLATARRSLFGALGLLEPVEGGVLLRAQADDLDWFARELSRLPFDFEIRRPVALRTALARRAEQLRMLAAGAASPVVNAGRFTLRAAGTTAARARPGGRRPASPRGKASP